MDEYNIASGPADKSLVEFARQSRDAGLSVLIPTDALSQFKTNPLQGRFRADEALENLLRNTGLSGAINAAGVLTITREGDMNMNVKREKWRAGWIGGLLSFVAAHASAQAPPSSEASELQEVVVTGSRLQVAGFNAPTPVTVIGSQTIEQRAPANIVDVLVEQPAFRIQQTDSTRAGGVNPQNTQATLDLRSLTPFRTLTLINGHRSVGTNWDNTVDSTIVPVGLVERVDVVTGGASAAYGSDAVAGVVNIVLNNKLQGVKATIQGGYTEFGGGKQTTLNLAGGTSLFDNRLHVIGGIDYNKTGAIKNVYGTSWGAAEIGNFAASAATRTALGLPQTYITNNVEPASTAPGGLYVNPTTNLAYTFDANGNPVAFQRGTVSSNGQLMIGSTSNYGHNTNDIVYVRPAMARLVALGRASYDITDNVNGYVEFSDARSALYPYPGSELQQGTGFGALTPAIVIAPTNPFVTAATKAILSSQTANLSIGRINTEFGWGDVSGNVARQDYDTRRLVAGLEGKFGAGWKWDASYSSGRTRLEQKRLDFSPVALQKAVDGCSVTATSPGFSAINLALVNNYELLSGKTCVPFNPFGVGRNSADALHYVTNDTSQVQHISLDNASASISGTPFRMPAGDAAVATGVEWRRETLVGVSDPISAAGTGTSQLVSNSLVASPYGENSVKEGFVEIGLPLLKDRPFAKSLDFNAAGRVTDYTVSGTVRTWKLGATWQPLDFMRLRFTRSHDIRAPNLRSLFFHGGPNSTNVIDSLPVGTVGLNGSVKTVAGTGAQISVPVPGNSGNPNLVPEIGDTTTGGVVFNFGGFDASIDYYQIYLNKAIAALGAQQTLDQCQQGDRTYCNFITFSASAPAGQNSILLLEPLLQNLNRIAIQGYDFEAGYRGQIGPGHFTARALINYEPHVQLLNAYLGQTTEAANVLGQIGGQQGAGGQPKFAYNLNFGYEVGKLQTNLQIRGFGQRRGNPIIYNADGSVNSSTILGPEDPGYNAANANTISKNRWPGQFTVNPGVAYRLTDKITGFVNVDNLFNVGPPELSTNGIYDLIGRRYRVGVRANY
jgi:outer membrane receptor protein involved in Fe transport